MYVYMYMYIYIYIYIYIYTYTYKYIYVIPDIGINNRNITFMITSSANAFQVK